MHIEQISRDKRRHSSDRFNRDALAMLPGRQSSLLREWLKSGADTPLGRLAQGSFGETLRGENRRSARRYACRLRRSSISCDADPDGVQISLHAGELWTARGLAWEPHAMGVENAAGSRRKLALTERDLQLALSLLSRPGLPPTLETLLQCCFDHRSKAEQENWL